MNEPNHFNSFSGQSPTASVIEASYIHHKQNKLQNLFNTPKKRFLMFSAIFGVMGVIALAVSFAATSHERDLVLGFRNFAKNRPTVVSGNGTMTYNDSPSLANAGVSFNTTLDHKTGNSAGKGQVRINKTVFPYEYVTFNKNHYFKLGNTPAARNVVKPGSPVYPYFASRFAVLDQVNNQWLVKGKQNGGPNTAAGPNYGCTLNADDVRLTAADARNLQAALLKNSPFKVQKVTNTTLAGEAVTESALVMSNAKKVDAFAARVSELEAVRKIDACAQKVANTKATPKVRDAFKSNNLKVSIFMNNNKVIKKIVLNTSGKKSTLQLNADFKYTPQPAIARPANAAPAAGFLRKMTTVVSASDQAKEADLYKIHVEIEKYIVKRRMLPATLAEMKIVGLRGNLVDYEYKYTSRTTGGGPTLVFQMCTTFASMGLKEIDTFTYGLTPEVFTMHRSGKNCYDNGYYKSSSHIRLLP
jgi:hypothetical protein